MKEYFNITDVSRVLGVARSTILSWIREGKVRGFQLPGGNHRIRREDLVKFMKEYGIPLGPLEQSEAKRVLVVDDDISILEILQEYLAQCKDIEVRTATTGFSTGVITQEFKPLIIAKTGISQFIYIGRVSECLSQKVRFLEHIAESFAQFTNIFCL